MPKKIHYFNPGHETAILLGTENYTPPTNVQKMIQELALLPIWYSEPEDYVLVNDDNSSLFLSLLPKEIHPFATPVTYKDIKKGISSSIPIEASPWGISPHSINLFEKLKQNSPSEITVPQWKDEYKQLTGRQTATECLNKIRELLPDMPIPVSPGFYTNIQEIEKYMLAYNAPFILKTPYSSSGRGLHPIDRCITEKDRTWINRAINKQGAISIECRLNKIQDFAMEFYSDGKGEVQYQGLSVFNTEEKGAYSGNVLQNQEMMRKRISSFTGETKLQHIQNTVGHVLKDTFGAIYSGYLGVDMLIYKDKGNYNIHPCIEINMRYTMGMVALRLFQKYIDSRATGDFRITYDGKAGEAYSHHHFMQETYPLKLEDGKIIKGYLSLCPVTTETHYRAYILIS
ncbi:hypothetical protein [Parabacteroides bouchesdurhonensis]|uniref:hypothetical protein n=1 Tax=Parabacteroides bouchesdurhonensis TaxID=1936995 RepID=UPI000C830711|nr:hypothetical protein [Parabacteroides bouchesdurhonensis]